MNTFDEHFQLSLLLIVDCYDVFDVIDVIDAICCVMSFL